MKVSFKVSSPHYWLISRSRQAEGVGHWEFVLEAADGSDRLVVDDCEPELGGERLALLAVVRGLEALDQPSRVTLVTPSAHVREGIRYGLPQWRRNGWRWECFGEMVPVKNQDLWRRIDRALQFHQLECRILRFDGAHGSGTFRGWERRRRVGAGAGWGGRLRRPAPRMARRRPGWLEWMGTVGRAARRVWAGMTEGVSVDLRAGRS